MNPALRLAMLMLDRVCRLLLRFAVTVSESEPEQPAIRRAVAEGEFDEVPPVEGIREAGGGDGVGVEAAEVLEVIAFMAFIAKPSVLPEIPGWQWLDITDENNATS